MSDDRGNRADACRVTLTGSNWAAFEEHVLSDCTRFDEAGAELRQGKALTLPDEEPVPTTFAQWYQAEGFGQNPGSSTAAAAGPAAADQTPAPARPPVDGYELPSLHSRDSEGDEGLADREEEVPRGAVSSDTATSQASPGVTLPTFSNAELISLYREHCAAAREQRKAWLEDVRRYKSCRGRLFSYLYNSMDMEMSRRVTADAALAQIREETDSLALFHLMRKHSLEREYANAPALEAQLITLRQREGEALAGEYAHRFESLRRRVEQAGIHLGDPKVCWHFATSLNQHFRARAAYVEEMDLTDPNFPSYTEVKEKLERWERTNPVPKTGTGRTHSGGGTSSREGAAMQLAPAGKGKPDKGGKKSQSSGSDRSGGGRKGKGNGGGNGGPPKSGQDSGPCHNCAQFGHNSFHCPSSVIACCKVCGMLYHRSRFCNARRQERAAEKGYSADNPQRLADLADQKGLKAKRAELAQLSIAHNGDDEHAEAIRPEHPDFVEPEPMRVEGSTGGPSVRQHPKQHHRRDRRYDARLARAGQGSSQSNGPVAVTRQDELELRSLRRSRPGTGTVDPRDRSTWGGPQAAAARNQALRNRDPNVTFERMCEWLFWFPNHDGSRGMTPTTDLPMGRDIPMEWLWVPRHFLTIQYEGCYGKGTTRSFGTSYPGGPFSPHVLYEQLRGWYYSQPVGPTGYRELPLLLDIAGNPVLGGEYWSMVAARRESPPQRRAGREERHRPPPSEYDDSPPMGTARGRKRVDHPTRGRSDDEHSDPSEETEASDDDSAARGRTYRKRSSRSRSRSSRSCSSSNSSRGRRHSRSSDSSRSRSGSKPPTPDGPSKGGGKSTERLCMLLHIGSKRERDDEPRGPRIIYDTGASVHTVSDLRLVREHVRPCTTDFRVEAVGGRVMRATHEGTIPGVGKVIVLPESRDTLISGPELDKYGFSVSVGGGRALITHTDRDPVVATMNSVCHYELSEDGLRAILGVTAPTPVYTFQLDQLTYGSTHYTPEQRRRAAEVGTLHHVMGHPNDETLGAALDNGIVVGTRLTSRDVKVWRSINGACAACIAGKAQKPHYGESKHPPAERVGQVLHADTYKFAKPAVGGHTVYLITVDEFSNHVSMEAAVNGKHDALYSAFSSIISWYRGRGHVVEKIQTDADHALMACEPQLSMLGVAMSAVPPYQHEQRVERCIQTLLSKFRCVLHSLAYVLPQALWAELLKSCVCNYNTLGNSKTPTQSPNMIVEGRRLDLAEAKSIPFGSVVMVHHAGRPRTDKMNSRGELGIVLGSAPTTYGASRCYTFDRGKIVTREVLTVLKTIPVGFPWPLRAVPLTDPEVFTRWSTPTVPPRSVPEMVETSNAGYEVQHIPPPMQTAEGDPTTEEEPPVEAPPQEILVDEDAAHAMDVVTSPSGKTKPHNLLADVEYEDTSPLDDSGPEIPADEPPARRSEREIRQTWKMREFSRAQQVATAYRLSVKEALNSPRAQETREAIRDEILNMLNYRVGHYVYLHQIPRRLRGNIIQSFMFIKHKTHPNGDYDKTKARLVGNGARQGDHMYDLISSSTVALSSVFILLCVASYTSTRSSCQVVSYDVKGAFLNAKFGPNDPITYIKINREVTSIWTDIDPSALPFVTEGGELVLELDKFIYGLKQSPHKFQLHLAGALESLGYVRLKNDECIFRKWKSNSSWSLLSTHVDDILQVATEKSYVEELRTSLTDTYGSVTFHPKADAYIGMCIRHNEEEKSFHLSQSGLVDKIIQTYMPEDKRVPPGSPAKDSLFADPPSDSVPVDRKRYLSLVMSLMYVARMTRPDILLPVTFLATRSTAPCQSDWDNALHVCRYLKGTRTDGVVLQCSSLALYLSCDASEKSHTDGKGHTGFFLFLGPARAFVLARSNKQKLAAQSSTEAEIVALCDALKVALYVRNILKELDIAPLYPITVEQDNKSAIWLSEKASAQKRSKHYLPRVTFIKDLVKQGILHIQHVRTHHIAADILTKPKHGKAFESNRSMFIEQ